MLYRAHYVSRAVEEELLQEKIPYALYSGVQFFNRMEIKDALSYLRMIAYQDDLSFRRIINVPNATWANGAWPFCRSGRGKHISLYEALQENVDGPLFKRYQGPGVYIADRNVFEKL